MPLSRRPRREAGEPAEPRGRGRWRTRARIIAVAVGAATILWLTLANTIGGIVHASQAGRVLAWSPFDARLRAGAALSAFAQVHDLSALPPVVALAGEALDRDPTNVDAVRILGFARYLQNRPREAQALFRYSDRLSRRDLGSRLVLIEERVRANDIDGALRQFDIALRTSPEAASILMPVLVSAAQEGYIARRIRAMLNASPPWRQAFFEPLVQTSRSRATAVYLVAGFLNINDQGDRFLARAALSRFLREGDMVQAWALYDTMIGQTGATRAAAIRDGGFDQGGDLPPIDWQLASDTDLAGIRQARPDAANNVALFAYSEGGRAGEVARQLLRLRPGPYQFHARVGNVPRSREGQPSVRIECAPGGNLLGKTFAELGSGQGFTVPAGSCANQWLIIEGGGLDGDQPLPWIDDIAIARVQ